LLKKHLVACALVCAVVPSAAQAAKPSGGGGGGTTYVEPLPGSMASTGDSITRGFNACGWYVDCAGESWSTGTDTAVNSQYLRLKGVNRSFGSGYNDAKTGAKMTDLNGQVTTAVGQRPDYITILMGANDACTSSEATMTDVATFRSQVDAALNTISANLPATRIFVASIPDVYRLWYVGHTSSSAVSAWNGFSVCQSILANPTSTAQADEDRRQRVRQRVVDFNAQLQQACAAHAHCLYDNNAVFSYPFVLSQVSGWDYFHPNKSGQAVLASETWKVVHATWGW
jgi:lysophospholipase L1-like esterase